MTNIKELSEELNQLIKTNEAQKFEIGLYKRQLLVILMNSGGILEKLNYDDISLVDWEKIQLGIGMTSCSISNYETRKIIKEWEDVPMLKAKQT